MIHQTQTQAQTSKKAVSILSHNIDEYILGAARDVSLTEGFFYDNGGKNGYMNNDYAVTTFHATADILEIYFSEFKIPEGSELRIYKGTTIHDPLVGAFKSSDKIWNIQGKDITIEYIPSRFVNAQTSGFAAYIHTIPSSSAHPKSLMPESDCPGAIPLCLNSTVIALGGLYTDTGAISDDAGSCYAGTGTGGSVWYTFTPQTNGPLDFTINPTGTTDYDFVVWDITNGCGSGQRVELSCNFSVYTGTTGLSSVNCNEAYGGGGNCTTNDCSTDSKNSDCNRFNRRINVLTTHQYAVCINFYSGSNDGFILAFKNEPTSVNITDNTPPYIINSYANACGGATILQIHFNEYCQCSTIQNSDFTLPGYSFNVTNLNCVNGATDGIELTVSPPMPLGTYSIHAQDILDMCGNNMNSNYNVVLGSVPVANAGPDKVTCKSPGFLGIGWTYSPASQTLTATGGGTYEWSDGQLGASISVSPTTTTSYIVTVTNGACIATDTCIVHVEPVPTPNLGPDIVICAGLPLTLNASGGGTYQWQVQTGTNFLGQPTFGNVAGATGSSYTTTPVQYGTSGATYYQVNVTSANGCTGSDQIKITFGAGVFSAIASPPVICAGSSSTLTVPASITSYTWTGGTTNTPYVVSPTVTTTYTVTSTTAGCTGTTSITVLVNSLPVVTATASNSNPCPGDVVTLNSTPSPVTSNVSENFEGTTQSLTLVNGANNKWYQGTATFCNGGKSLYIGTAAANNNYVNFNVLTGIAAVNFAYMDVPVSGYCSSNLTFNWKCLGKATDNLTVWAIPATVVPVAGTALTATGGNVQIGGPYWNNATACTPASISLLPFINTTIRIVFQWQNAAGNILGGNSAANPAASIDDILISQNSSYTYSWTSVPPGFTSTAQSPTVTPTSNTVYNLTTTRCDGCVNSDTAAVTLCVNIPHADFSVSDTTICVGSCVNYTNLSVNSTSWNWTFAGAATPSSTLQNPLGICYNTAGNYNVTLIAINANGTDTMVKTLFIHVITPPTVSVTPAVSSICAGNTLTLVSSGATTYVWSPATGLNTTTGNTVIASPTVATTYSVIGTTSECSDTATATITINPNLVVDITALPNPICAGTSTTLTASGATNYTWSGGLGTTNPLIVSPNTTTTYFVTGNTSGCTGSDSITIIVNSNLIIDVTASPNPICAGSPSSLTASGATTYVWGGGLGTANPLTVTPNVTTTYTVTGNTLGCVGTDSVTVTVITNLTVNITASQSSICSGNSTTLTASGATNYTWSGGLGTSNPLLVSPTITTLYTVTGTTSGCVGTDSITVTVKNNPIVNVDPVSVCKGVTAILTATGANSYIWNTGSSGNPLVLTPSATAIFSVTGTDLNGCTGSDTALLTVYPKPIANFQPNPTLTSTDDPTINFNNTSIGGTLWFWNFGDPNSTDNNSFDFSPVHTYSSYGYFPIWLIAENNYGCIDSTVRYVTVENPFTVYIPSAFTPNEDSKNEIFIPKGVGIDPSYYEMTIFDRWGELVFTTDNLLEGWNGKKNNVGSTFPSGVYVYHIKLRQLGGKIYHYTGHVTLIK